MYVAPDALIKAIHMHVTKPVRTVERNIEMLTDLYVTKFFFCLVISSWKIPREAKLKG